MTPHTWRYIIQLDVVKVKNSFVFVFDYIVIDVSQCFVLRKFFPSFVSFPTLLTQSWIVKFIFNKWVTFFPLPFLNCSTLCDPLRYHRLSSYKPSSVTVTTKRKKKKKSDYPNENWSLVVVPVLETVLSLYQSGCVIGEGLRRDFVGERMLKM